VAKRDASGSSDQLGRPCCVGGWHAMATHVLP